MLRIMRENNQPYVESMLQIPRTGRPYALISVYGIYTTEPGDRKLV